MQTIKIPMKDELSKEQTEAILKALDDAIADGPWEKSNFLRVIGKKLNDIREKFVSQLHTPGSDKEKLVSDASKLLALHSNHQEIFISVYSTDGTNIRSWEKILLNLPKQMVYRSIYTAEDDVIELIKTKPNKNNEAYVSIYINPNDILVRSQDKTPLDKLGKPMLSLKDNSISLDNINQFVHASGTYRLFHGQLVKIINEDS